MKKLGKATVIASVALTGVVGIPGVVSASPAQLPAGDVSPPRLHVRTIESRDVPGYVRVSAQEGTVTGVPRVAAARINHDLEVRVAAATAYATRDPQSPCPAAADACGYLVQRLTSYTCISHTMCIAQPVSSLLPGSNDAEEWVDTAAYDTRTGRKLRLSQVVSAAESPAFLRAVNAGIQAQLRAAGVNDPETWGTPVTLKDVHAWLPRPHGVQVWFSRYEVAPGSFGVVTVTVPWAAIR